MITYEINNNLYLNITNRCTNNCSFCIRHNNKGVGYNLWLKTEPSLEEILAAVGKAGDYHEYVFCGFGEPLLRLPEVIATARYLKRKGKRVRINTNGQAGLIWPEPVAPQMAGLVDAISISLNAADEKSYLDLCQPHWGVRAYSAILDFTKECLRYIPEVTLSVVDLLPEEEIKKCALIASDLGAAFRIRHYETE
jgi:TatD family-associated radical SAM protein